MELEVIRRIEINKPKCRWVVRPGTCNSFWAYTACTKYKDYCYLSKVSNRDSVKSVYEKRICPKCNGIIEIDDEL